MSVPNPNGDIAGVDTMEIIGGRLALMFVNTTNWIGDEAVDDRLSDVLSLTAWARRVGLDPGPNSAPANLGQVDVADLRDQLRRSLDASEPRAEAHENVRALIADVEAPEIGLSADCRFILSAVLFSAIDIITTDAIDHLRRCPGSRCGWMFLDTSPGKRRRWCSMTSCGNRAKSRRHYQLMKTGDEEP